MTPPDLRIHGHLLIPAEELVLSYVRSSGPGGQNVNKVATKVQVRWNPGASAALGPVQRQRIQEKLGSRLTGAGELILNSDRYRSQDRNRNDVLERLAEVIRSALHRPKARRPTKATRGSVRRRLEGKKRLGDKKNQRRKPVDE